MKRTLKFALLACFVLLASVFLFTSCNNHNNCKHDNPSQIESIGAVASTCQKTGLTEGMRCNLCKTMVVPQRIVEIIECRESEWITDKEVTKTENGMKHTECSMCGKRMSEEIIFAGGSIGLDYLVNSDNKSCAIRGIGDCLDSEVVIPTVIDGYEVTSIWKNAFYGSKTLTGINISNSITSIGGSAFAYCDSLANIVVPDNVTSVGEMAFFDCDNLASVTIGNGVTHIGVGAFGLCKSLNAIIFEGTVEQWSAISKGKNWNWQISECTIYCINGQITEKYEAFKVYGVGDMCPSLDIPIYNGDEGYTESFNPADNNGKVTVINFWGVWCPSCSKELPYFDQIATDFYGEVDIVAIHTFDDMDSSDEYIEENYPDSKILFGVDSLIKDGDRSSGEYLYNTFGGQGTYPITIIVDPNGEIFSIQQTELDYDTLLVLIMSADSRAN